MRTTALLLLNLDHFKNVNDTAGHGLGDAMLAAAAGRIDTVAGVAGEGDSDHRLVAGIIALAKSLNIAVAAEGVEPTEQAARLRSMGCPSAEGRLYAKAAPPESVTALLTRDFAPA